MTEKIAIFLKHSGFKVLMLLIIGIVFTYKDLDFSVRVTSPKFPAAEPTEPIPPTHQRQNLNEHKITKKSNKGDMKINKSDFQPLLLPKMPIIQKGQYQIGSNLMSFLEKVEEEKKQAYINRFSHVAVTEMKKFGIPASIILGQGLLNSCAGTSIPAEESSNHFGIGCDEWNGKQAIYEKICYRDYKNDWHSYRDHSKYITGGEFAHLTELNPQNYKSWAKGLEKVMFTQKSDYAETLIQLIDDYDLDRFDE